MPGMTPLRRDEVRSARAWAAFVADDATATPRPSLEARVLRAAHAALAQKQRDDAERRRRHWFAGCTAIAASLLAAAAWSLAPRAHTSADSAATPAGVSAPQSVAAASTEIRPAAAPSAATRTAGMPPAIAAHEFVNGPQRPLPMTNVEAGRVLGTPPRLLASRPIFDPMDGASPIAAPGQLRARSFSAPTVEPTFAHGRPTHSIPATSAPVPALAAAPVVTPSPLDPTAGPQVWSSRGFDGVFDPESKDKPFPPPIRLDQAAPGATPREDPPAPPH
jgi:hypothetical protein